MNLVEKPFGWIFLDTFSLAPFSVRTKKEFQGKNVFIVRNKLGETNSDAFLSASASDPVDAPPREISSPPPHSPNSSRG